MGNTFSIGGVPSRDAAFVMRLTYAGDDAGDQTTGRVEHVRSGRTAMQALLRFMRETLAGLDIGTELDR